MNGKQAEAILRKVKNGQHLVLDKNLDGLTLRRENSYKYNIVDRDFGGIAFSIGHSDARDLVIANG